KLSSRASFKRSAGGMLMYKVLLSQHQHSSLCADWPKKACIELADKCYLRTTKKESPLFNKEQLATHLYVLATRQVSMCLRTQTGSERVVYQLQWPASFGEVYMLMQNNYPLDAYAVTDCDLAVVPFATFVGVLAQHEHALEKVLGLLAKRLFALTGDL